MLNSLSIDVEEYFHPSEVRQYVSETEWSGLPSRVEQQTHVVLDLLAKHGARATFFILGWVARRHPQLVRAIDSAGHELGCHSFAHNLVYDMTPETFRQDTEEAVRAIADAAGKQVCIYRAPSYSITERSMWALDVLAGLGFTHDSSIYPIAHDRYGIPGFGRNTQDLSTAAGFVREVPIATVALPGGRIAPVGGGAYLRLLPYRYTAAGIRRRNDVEQQPACIYLHPWELDPDQPRLASGVIARLRTYSGLRSMRGKLDRLLRDFRFAPVGNIPVTAGTSPDGTRTAAARSGAR